MAYRSKYVGRYGGIGTMLSRPWMHVPCKKAALEIQAAAQVRAPVGDPTNNEHAGRYKAGFAVVPLTKNVPFRGKPRMRNGARVLNVTPEVLIVEYGNQNTPRYAVFRKSIDDVKAGHRG
ncbi:hypothetical protein [Streptomyces sp. NPDC006638]|uniref:hypothetical protein n=1 Tax=Streptomyces sp. NPDC006638 TaxID=3157183 RepID=UPI0033B33A19